MAEGRHFCLGVWVFPLCAGFWGRVCTAVRPGCVLLCSALLGSLAKAGAHLEEGQGMAGWKQMFCAAGISD